MLIFHDRGPFTDESEAGIGEAFSVSIAKFFLDNLYMTNIS